MTELTIKNANRKNMSQRNRGGAGPGRVGTIISKN